MAPKSRPVEWTLSLLRPGRPHGALCCRSSDPTPEPVHWILSNGKTWCPKMSDFGWFWYFETKPKLPKTPWVYDGVSISSFCFKWSGFRCWALRHGPWRKTGLGALRGWALPVGSSQGMSWWLPEAKGAPIRRSHEEVKDEIHSFRKDLTCWDGISNETSHDSSHLHCSIPMTPTLLERSGNHTPKQICMQKCSGQLLSSEAEGLSSNSCRFDRAPGHGDLVPQSWWWISDFARRFRCGRFVFWNSEEHTKQTAYCLQSWKQQSCFFFSPMAFWRTPKIIFHAIVLDEHEVQNFLGEGKLQAKSSLVRLYHQ